MIGSGEPSLRKQNETKTRVPQRFLEEPGLRTPFLQSAAAAGTAHGCYVPRSSPTIMAPLESGAHSNITTIPQKECMDVTKAWLRYPLGTEVSSVPPSCTFTSWLKKNCSQIYTFGRSASAILTIYNQIFFSRGPSALIFRDLSFLIWFNGIC